MKKLTLHTALLFAIICVISCSQNKQTIPPPVTDVAATKTLLAGKKWQVSSVATVSGSQESLFDNDQLKTAAVVAPRAESLNWLSATKDDKNNQFIADFCKKSLDISIALNKDSVATTTGLEVAKQTYTIDNNKDAEEPKGMALFLTQKGEGAGPMGAGEFTTTYYILGASENKLYLLTPNKLNGLQVVYLLTATN